MKISNHKLDCKQIPSPNFSGSITNPTLLVLHYTASGGSGESDAKYFQNPAAKASAHLVVDRDGTVVQCVDFNKKAWHAGKSTWKGRANCNDFSIGIEIDNWGVLTKTEDGTYKSWQGEKIPASNVISAKNKLGNHGYWETYPKSQLDAVEACCAAILASYPSITEIVGHEDIAPGRKVDPGPALYEYMRKLNNKFFNDRQNEAEPGNFSRNTKKTVTATSLNVRSSPSSSAPKVASLMKGDEVEVMKEEASWSQIRSPIGWVASQYLK